jgi:hypothetical protein
VSRVQTNLVFRGHVGGLSPDTSRADVAQLKNECNSLSTGVALARARSALS